MPPALIFVTLNLPVFVEIATGIICGPFGKLWGF